MEKTLIHLLERRTTYTAQMHSAAEATVSRMNKGLVAIREPSMMIRNKCATVIKPKIAPVVIT